jgi:hypothetical protein
MLEMFYLVGFSRLNTDREDEHLIDHCTFSVTEKQKLLYGIVPRLQPGCLKRSHHVTIKAI